MQHMDVVPDILTGKDLDYLCDMFNWNYFALKKAHSYLDLTDNETVKNVISESCNLFNSNMQCVLSILKEANNNEQ